MRRAIRALTCAAVLAAPSAPALAAPLNGQLAAVVDDRLVTVNPDGTGLRTLWSPPGEISGPAWSPDGNRLALAYAGRIVVFDVAAGSATAVTAGPRDLDPAWSADGRLGFRRVGQGRQHAVADGAESPLDPLTTAF